MYASLGLKIISNKSKGVDTSRWFESNLFKLALTRVCPKRSAAVANSPANDGFIWKLFKKKLIFIIVNFEINLKLMYYDYNSLN